MFLVDILNWKVQNRRKTGPGKLMHSEYSQSCIISEKFTQSRSYYFQHS